MAGGDALRGCQDLDDDPLTWSVVQSPSRGTLTLEDGRLRYVPEPGAGSDTAVVRATDPSGASDTQEVSFFYEQPGTRGWTTCLSPTDRVLRAGETAVVELGCSWMPQVVTPPTRGTITGVESGLVTYRPDPLATEPYVDELVYRPGEPGKAHTYVQRFHVVPQRPRVAIRLLGRRLRAVRRRGVRVAVGCAVNCPMTVAVRVKNREVRSLVSSGGEVVLPLDAAARRVLARAPRPTLRVSATPAGFRRPSVVWALLR